MGLFNAISAIFVDATMQYAAKLSLNQQTARLTDDSLWAKCLSQVVQSLWRESIPPSPIGDHGLFFSEACGATRDTENVVSELFNATFPTSVMDAVCCDPGDSKLSATLKALDIDACDHRRLSEILDPDHCGTISMLDLVEGLHRMRGPPSRGDVVAVDLMIRSLQRTSEKIFLIVQTTQQSMETLMKQLRRQHINTRPAHQHEATVSAQLSQEGRRADASMEALPPVAEHQVQEETSPGSESLDEISSF